MKKIVAIGGGEIKDLETLPIDLEIAKLTEKNIPKALFIPTASGDAEGYWETFQKVYGEKLQCKTEVLYLIKDDPDIKEIERKILGSDLVYVGGGDTLKMLNIWREKGVDNILKKAYEEGIVMSGLSAGAICWFRYGSSDTKRFSDPEDSSFVRIKGLDLINLTLSPHHLRENNRDEGLKMIMKNTPGIGIGLDDNCALEIVGDEYRFITSKEGAGAKKVFYRSGIAVVKGIEIVNSYRPISELSQK